MLLKDLFPELEFFSSKSQEAEISGLCYEKYSGKYYYIKQDNELVSIDLPGATNLQLDIIDNYLTIQWTRDSYSYTERIKLKSDIDQDKVDATYKDGILMINTPRAKPPSKSISIKTS